MKKFINGLTNVLSLVAGFAAILMESELFVLLDLPLWVYLTMMVVFYVTGKNPKELKATLTKVQEVVSKGKNLKK